MTTAKVKKSQRFLTRTLANINATKTSTEKCAQLLDSMHPSLASERADLQDFMDKSQSIKRNSKSAEYIRHCVKRFCDKILGFSHAVSGVLGTSRDLCAEWTDIANELSDATEACEDGTETEVSKRFSYNSAASGPGPGDDFVVEELSAEILATRLKSDKRPVIKEQSAPNGGTLWNHSYVDSTATCTTEQQESQEPPPPPVQDLQILLFLVRTCAGIQAELHAQLERLNSVTEESISKEFTAYVKGSVRAARYEGHEFLNAYGQYQDHLRNLNQTVIAKQHQEDVQQADLGGNRALKNLLSHTSSMLKPSADVKRVESLKTQVFDSKQVLDIKSRQFNQKYDDALMEFETGVVPSELLQYIKEVRSVFKNGLDACERMFPNDLMNLVEGSLKQRSQDRKTAFEITSTGQSHEIPQVVETECQSQRTSSSSLADKENSPVTPAALVVQPVHAATAPNFAPPLPPSKPPAKSSIAPSIPAPLPPKKSVKVVTFPQSVFTASTMSLLQQITDPQLHLLKKLLLDPSSSLYRRSMNTGSVLVPLPTDVHLTGSPTALDAIQRAVQLIIESGKVSDWLDVVWSSWFEKVVLTDVGAMESGSFSSLWLPYAPEQQGSFVRIIQQHVFWLQGRPYVQKCVREVVAILGNYRPGSVMDWLEIAKRVWKVILGHRGLIPRSLKQVLKIAESHVETQLGKDSPSLESKKQRLVCLLMFHQLIFPALKHCRVLLKHWNSQQKLPNETTDSYLDADCLGMLEAGLCSALELPLPVSLKPGLMRAVKENTTELKLLLRDFYKAVNVETPPPSNPPIVTEPDVWMLEVWAGEWLNLYQ